MYGSISIWTNENWFSAIVPSVIGGLLGGNEIWKNRETVMGPKSEVWRLFE